MEAGGDIGRVLVESRNGERKTRGGVGVTLRRRFPACRQGQKSRLQRKVIVTYVHAPLPFSPQPLYPPRPTQPVSPSLTAMHDRSQNLPSCSPSGRLNTSGAARRHGGSLLPQPGQPHLRNEKAK